MRRTNDTARAYRIEGKGRADLIHIANMMESQLAFYEKYPERFCELSGLTETELEEFVGALRRALPKVREKIKQKGH